MEDASFEDLLLRDKSWNLHEINIHTLLIEIYKSIKADLHSTNFSRANNTFRWRMLSFQSPFEENEIWIKFVKPHVLFTHSL